MESIRILNANIVNEGRIFTGDVLIKNGLIEKIGSDLSQIKADREINAEGLHLFPGVIDDQVHFREPGLTHKAQIFTESRAAVAGGITTFMEMPNTVPNTLSQQLLQDKYDIGARDSLANYSFYMGVSNDNLEEALKTDEKNVCGLKVFMGSSTGNMLVDKEETLRGIFSRSSMLIATHCEDEEIIQENMRAAKEQYGEDVPISMHPDIRNEAACYKSSFLAVSLAKEYGTRLHVLHISTGRELNHFIDLMPLKDKKITCEACVHHLWFDDKDYEEKGTLIKWNPAVKAAEDREMLIQGVLEGVIDVIATDHAPHTLEEKLNPYFSAPSGGPLVQHSLPAMLEFYHNSVFSLELIAEKMCHNPAILFGIKDRGFIREGYKADLTLVNLNSPWEVSPSNIISKCKWSPFEGETFNSGITHTIVSGHLAYANGIFNENKMGERLRFER